MLFAICFTFIASYILIMKRKDKMKAEVTFKFDDRDNGLIEDRMYPYIKGKDMLLALWKISEMLSDLYNHKAESMSLDVDTIEHVIGEFNSILDDMDIDLNKLE